MRVQVTQKHINKSEIGQGTKCPIALALAEAYPGHLIYSVGYSGFSVGDRDDHGRYRDFISRAWKTRMSNWIRAFDKSDAQHTGIKPTWFEVD